MKLYKFAVCVVPLSIYYLLHGTVVAESNVVSNDRISPEFDRMWGTEHCHIRGTILALAGMTRKLWE